MKGGGRLKGNVNGQYYHTWAKYLVKSVTSRPKTRGMHLRFFEEYAQQGVDFWGMTTQNEPSSGAVKSYAWQTMFWDAEMQRYVERSVRFINYHLPSRQFIKGVLGPMLRNHSASSHLKVMVNDDNRYMLPSYVHEVVCVLWPCTRACFRY